MHLIVVNVREGKEWHYSSGERRIYIGSSLVPGKSLSPKVKFVHNRVKRLFASFWQWVKYRVSGGEFHNQLIIDGIAAHHVLLEDDGWNIRVTNLVDSAQTSLAEVNLAPNESRIWTVDQELRLNEDVVLFLSPIAKDEPGRSSLRRTAHSFWRYFTWLLIFSFLLFIGWVLLGDPIGWTKSEETPTATAIITTTVTATATLAPSPTLPPLTINSTPIATLPMFVPQDGPVATQTTSAKETADATLTPSTPVPTATPRSIQSSVTPSWSPSTIAQPTVGLNLTFTPARGLEGQNYWQLVKVIWLNQAVSGGRHTIYVDVRDEQNNPLPEAHVLVKWGDGGCEGYMPKLADLRGLDRTTDLNFDNYHIQCPMYSAGRAYSVMVDGDPSDLIAGLGLGTPENREQPILTSFLLIFQRSKLK